MKKSLTILLALVIGTLTSSFSVQAAPEPSHFTRDLCVFIEQANLPAVMNLFADANKYSCSSPAIMATIDSRTGCTPLQIAIAAGNLEMIEYFYENSMVNNDADEHGNTPLHFAITRNQLAVIKYLYEETGAVIDKKAIKLASPTITSPKKKRSNNYGLKPDHRIHCYLQHYLTVENAREQKRLDDAENARQDEKDNIAGAENITYNNAMRVITLGGTALIAAATLAAVAAGLVS